MNNKFTLRHGEKKHIKHPEEFEPHPIIQKNIERIKNNIPAANIDELDAAKKKAEMTQTKYQNQYDDVTRKRSGIEARKAELRLKEYLTEKDIRYFNILHRDCSDILNNIQRRHMLFYSGVKNTSSINDALVFESKSKEYREPRHDNYVNLSGNVYFNKVFDSMLTACNFKALRSNSVFLTADWLHAKNFGKVYIIFPKNGYELTTIGNMNKPVKGASVDEARNTFINICKESLLISSLKEPQIKDRFTNYLNAIRRQLLWIANEEYSFKSKEYSLHDEQNKDNEIFKIRAWLYQERVKINELVMCISELLVLINIGSCRTDVLKSKIMRLQSFYEKYINQVPPDASVKYPVLVMPELLQDALLEANNILEISNTDELTTPDNAKKILEYYGVHDNLDVVYAGYNGEILIRGSYYAFDFDAYYKKITAYFIDNFFNGVRW